jgi:hypothetical protein
MSLLNALKQNETAAIASAALTVGVIAGVGCAVMAYRQDRMEKRLQDLETFAGLSAKVTLNLTNAVGQLTAKTENPIT